MNKTDILLIINMISGLFSFFADCTKVRPKKRRLFNTSAEFRLKGDKKIAEYQLLSIDI